MEKNIKEDILCTLCGSNYNNIAFKAGYICENCISIFKDLSSDDKCGR